MGLLVSMVSFEILLLAVGSFDGSFSTGGGANFSKFFFKSFTLAVRTFADKHLGKALIEEIFLSSK